MAPEQIKHPDEVVITPMEWLLEDKRPDGYVPTTEVRLRAEAKGVRYRRIVAEPLRKEWALLLRKAKTRGLSEREAKRIAKLSATIHQAMQKALEE